MEAGDNAQAALPYHLGIGKMCRAALADADAKRSPAPFAGVARALLAPVPRRRRREGEELLYLLDVTPIELQEPGFDAWSAASRTYRTQGCNGPCSMTSRRRHPVKYSLSALHVNDVSEGIKSALEPAACDLLRLQ